MKDIFAWQNILKSFRKSLTTGTNKQDKETLLLELKRGQCKTRVHRKHTGIKHVCATLINQRQDASSLQGTSKSEHGGAARGL